MRKIAITLLPAAEAGSRKELEELLDGKESTLVKLNLIIFDILS
jgi:hypothetical protein